MPSRLLRTLNIRMVSVLAVAFAATPLHGQVEQIAILRPDTPTTGFGSPVAMSGDFVIVAASQDSGLGFLAGVAFVFHRSGDTWEQQTRLTASDGVSYDRFGFAVAIDGDVIVVGAPHIDPVGVAPGAAYVFRRNGNAWIEEAILVSSGSTNGDSFGWSVSVDGDRILVGARSDSRAGFNEAGAAYVFRRNSGAWVEEAALIASDAESGDLLGGSVAIEGDLLVVGAIGDDDGGNGTGAAYVFLYDGTHWVEETKLTAADPGEIDLFGFPVSLSDSQAFIGALSNDINGQNSGAAYVFSRRNVGDWRQQKLAPVQGEFNDFFRAGSIDGNLLIAGAPGDDSACPGATSCDTGATYLFMRIGSTWQQQLQFFASDAVQPFGFGTTSWLDGKNAVVGSLRAAYVFSVERQPDGIPALSSWGLVAMLLLLLVLSKVFFRTRQNHKQLGRSRINALCLPVLLSVIVQSVSKSG